MRFTQENFNRLLKNYKEIDPRKIKVFQCGEHYYVVQYKKGMFKIERHPFFSFSEPDSEEIMQKIKEKLNIIERGLRALKGIKY